MISVTEGQATIDQHVTALEAETVSLAEVHGRVLREAVASAEDIPGFDRSAMDGYAVRLDDVHEVFEVVGEIRAGSVVDQELQPGQAIRIFTGARMPGAGLRVILQEHVEAHGARIWIVKKSAAICVRHRGEDARAGESLLEKGMILNAAACALLASLGHVSVQVSRQPRILHLTTGDEIVPPAETPRSGQIRNSNASLIAALCREHGGGAVTHLHAPDDLAVMTDMLSQAKTETFDLVLISGGSGPGAYDFSGKLFEHLGATLHFRQVNVRPGKPLMFGTTSSQIVFGLPGNALSHFVCFHLFVRRALERLVALPVSATVQARLAEAMAETMDARDTWWPAQVQVDAGQLMVRALPWKSSGDITRLPAAQAVLHVPASTSNLPAGTMVDMLSTQSSHAYACS